MKDTDDLKTADYTLRIIMALLAITILTLILTSIISGILAIISSAVAILFVIFSVTGYKKLKSNN